jgi:uncharacterized membrane protein
MSQLQQKSTDARLEQTLGQLLQIGVLLAAAVVMAGGIVYLARHGGETVDYPVFRSEPGDLRSPMGIMADVLMLRSRGIIQFGLLLLIATPVARVIFSAFAFARQRDFTYVILTLIVLAVLLYSLFFGHPQAR